MNAELPPLHQYGAIFIGPNGQEPPVAYYAYSVEARERILQARIAELEADAERRREAFGKADTFLVRWAANRFQQPDESDVRNALRRCADIIDAAKKA